MADAKKTYVLIDGVRLGGHGTLEYEVFYEEDGVRLSEWYKKTKINKLGIQHLLTEFEKKQTEAQRGRSTRKSPRVSRARTRSPSRKQSKSPEKQQLNFNFESSEEAHESSEEKVEETTTTIDSTTYTNLPLPSRFWLVWDAALLLSFVASLTVTLVKASVSKETSYAGAITASQILNAVPYLLFLAAIYTQGSSSRKKFATFTMHSIFYLMICVIFEDIVEQFIPEEAGVSKIIPFADIHLLLHFLWISLFFAAYREMFPKDLAIFGKAKEASDLLISFVCFVLVQVLDKLEQGKAELRFGHYGIVFLSLMTLMHGMFNIVHPKKTISKNELYMLLAQVIAFFFTLMFVLRVIYGSKFSHVQHITVTQGEEFILHLDSVQVMETVLRWCYAGVLTLLAL